METELKKKNSKKKVLKDDLKLERIIFDDLEGKFLLIRVGTPEVPASTEDINDIEKKLNKLLEENNVNCIALITHHAVNVQLIEKNK